jgi:hypothetical protein
MLREAKRKLRASVTSATRPSPICSNRHGAAIAPSPMPAAKAAQQASAAGRKIAFVTELAASYLGQTARLSGQGKGRTMEINGMAHLILTASDFVRSRAFYPASCHSSAWRR